MLLVGRADLAFATLFFVAFWVSIALARTYLQCWQPGWKRITNKTGGRAERPQRDPSSETYQGGADLASMLSVVAWSGTTIPA